MFKIVLTLFRHGEFSKTSKRLVALEPLWNNTAVELMNVKTSPIWEIIK